MHMPCTHIPFSQFLSHLGLSSPFRVLKTGMSPFVFATMANNMLCSHSLKKMSHSACLPTPMLRNREHIHSCFLAYHHCGFLVG